MRTKRSTRNSPRSKQIELRLGTSQADSGGPGPGDKGHNTPTIYHPSCISGIEKIGVVKSGKTLSQTHLLKIRGEPICGILA